jgi:MoxR-like ATPase
VGALKASMARVIIGQEDVVDLLVTCLLAGGHALVEGVPGLGKTLLVKSLAQATDMEFRRVQFTPDLMPSDIVGTEILEEDTTTRQRVFRFQQGPVFTQVLLADEINRAPPKTQSALLEAMQERAVTFAGTTHKLPRPFFVLATQNPIEQAGTYPLPEAQLDRFLFNVLLDYLPFDEEMQVLGLTTTTHIAQADTVTNAQEILDMQQLVRMVPVAESVAKYAVSIVRATRPTDPLAPEIVKKYLNFGASVRGIQNIILASKARALMQNRYHVSFDDIAAMSIPVLRHRVLLNFHAESDKVSADTVLKKIIESIAIPRD